MFQPFSDALKLFSKNLNFLSKINELLWNFSPLLIFFLFIIILNFIPIKIENNKNFINLIIIILIIRLFVFPIIWRRFFSFRKFRLIRSKRCISQLLSYEIGLIFIFIFLIFIILKINVEIILLIYNKIFLNKIIILLLIFILILRESRRIPFDFIEGESELISGFNIEFSSSYFSLFFIYEYGIILFLRLVIRIILLNFYFNLFLIFIFIIIRSCFPRIRYDLIIIYFWKIFYPIIISLIIFFNI